MKNQSKSVPALIGASMLCAAGGLLWLSIKHIGIPLAEGLTGGANSLNESLSSNDSVKTTGNDFVKNKEEE